jgi:hypothetical protein
VTRRLAATLRRAAGTAVLAASVATAAACGVPQDDSPRTLPAEDVPYDLLSPSAAATPTPSPTGPRLTVPRIYLLDSTDQLVARPLSLNATGLEPVERALLDALSAGPTEDQRSEGLGTALGPGVGLTLVDVVDGTARVTVTPSESTPSADRLPLAVGQVVLTLTSVDGVDAVQIVRDGQPVPAPLPGGEQTSDPLTAADYASLVTPSSSRTTKAEPGPSTTAP